MTNHDQVIRRYWASRLKVEIGRDGSVPGFADWFRDARPHEKRQAFDEMLAEIRLQGLESELDPKTWGTEDVERQEPAYMAMRLALGREIEAQKLRPFEVAAYLEQRRATFRQIDPREIAAYRRMGEIWQRWQGFDADYVIVRRVGVPYWNPETQRVEPWPHTQSAEIVRG